MITCNLCGINQDLTWFVTAVYVACGRNESRELWEELGAMRSLREGPWVECGDFNTTRFPSEKTNCVRLSGGMTDLSSCINELELIDPHLFGDHTLGEEGKITEMPPRLIDSCIHSHGMKCSIKLRNAPCLVCVIPRKSESRFGKKKCCRKSSWVQLSGTDLRIVQGSTVYRGQS